MFRNLKTIENFLKFLVTMYRNIQKLQIDLDVFESIKKLKNEKMKLKLKSIQKFQMNVENLEPYKKLWNIRNIQKFLK